MGNNRLFVSADLFSRADSGKKNEENHKSNAKLQLLKTNDYLYL